MIDSPHVLHFRGWTGRLFGDTLYAHPPLITALFFLHITHTGLIGAVYIINYTAMIKWLKYEIVVCPDVMVLFL